MNNKNPTIKKTFFARDDVLNRLFKLENACAGITNEQLESWQLLNGGILKTIKMQKDYTNKLESINAKLIELLADARDDITDKVYFNSQMLPYKQSSYDASVKQLADIDALLDDIEMNK